MKYSHQIIDKIKTTKVRRVKQSEYVDSMAQLLLSLIADVESNSGPTYVCTMRTHIKISAVVPSRNTIPLGTTL